jgi:hypothetical protein
MLATPDPETIPTAVGAVVGALAVDGQLVPAQQATLEAFVRVFGDGSLDVGAVEALGPDEVAAAIVDPAVRHQVVQAMVVLAFMEHPPSAERQRSIRRYARALHVDDKAVKVLGEYAHGHTKRMLLDTFRYMPMAEWEHAFAQDEGYGTVARSLLATFDKSESPKVAACGPAPIRRPRTGQRWRTPRQPRARQSAPAF